MIEKINIRFLIKQVFLGLFITLIYSYADAQVDQMDSVDAKKIRSKKTLYGQASFYANKFHGRLTANGEIFNQDKLTAACNVLPLGTRIRVTNLKNGKSIVVRTNDRLHPKTRRIIDLTRKGAKQLGYISRGLTRVKMEVLDQKLHK